MIFEHITTAEAAQFVDGAGELYSDIEFTGEITDVRLFCRYTGDTPLEAEVEIDFAFGKGPSAGYLSAADNGKPAKASLTATATAFNSTGRPPSKTSSALVPGPPARKQLAAF